MSKEKTSLEKLLDSDKYIRIYNGAKQTLPSATDVLNAYNLTPEFIKIGSPTLIQSSTTGEEVEVYSNYVIESKLHNNEVIDGFYGTVGILVNNSQNKISVYQGANASACTNLCIFGADSIVELNLTKSIGALDSVIDDAVKNLMSKLLYIKQRKEELEAITYSTKEFEDRKGNLLSKIGLAHADYLIHAEGKLRDRNSIYYDMPKSDWTLLQSMTDLVKKKSPTKRLEDTLALEKLFI